MRSYNHFTYHCHQIDLNVSLLIPRYIVLELCNRLLFLFGRHSFSDRNSMKYRQVNEFYAPKVGKAK